MARCPPQTRYAQSSAAKIAYQVSGAGAPDLLMVPGLVSHLDLQWQLAATQPGRTVGLILYGTSFRGPRSAQLRRYQSVVRHCGFSGRRDQSVAKVRPGIEQPTFMI